MNLFRHILYITALLFFTTLLTTACSSDSTLDDEHVVDTRKPMVFGTSTASAESTVTRASAPLEDGFMVSTWKNFALSTQQTVMNQYQVAYTAEATSYKWNYVDVNGQPQRYWDLSAFPYEFRAVTPYNADKITITDAGISLANTSFTAQTLINDVLSTAQEPFLVSHVKRVKDNTEYPDYDLLRKDNNNNALEINATNKAVDTREVHMPFHHLVSKIGFRLFINDPQPSAPDYRVYLKRIKISVKNENNNFVTASTTYNATNAQGLINGTFSDNTQATGEYMLLQHEEYADVDFRQHLSLATAYDFTPNFLQQIPQGNVKLHVVLDMETDHITGTQINGRNPFHFDVLLSLDKTITTGDLFKWNADTRYIYYLHIPNLHGHVIYVNTCQVLPWEEVQTSDIPIEL